MEMVPDYALRLRAMPEALDRAYGRPKQATELTGPGGRPAEVTAQVDVGNPQITEAAYDFLRKASRAGG